MRAYGIDDDYNEQLGDETVEKIFGFYHVWIDEYKDSYDQ